METGRIKNKQGGRINRIASPSGNFSADNFFSSLSQVTQTSTPAVLEKPRESALGIIGRFARGVGQSIARSVGSAALTVSGNLQTKRDPITGEIKDRVVVEPLRAEDMKTFFGQALFENVFGKGEEIKPIETRIAEAEPKIKEWSDDIRSLSEAPDLTPKEKAITTVLGNLNPTQIAFLGVMGSVGLDLTPFGGLEKNAFRAIVKETTETGAEQLLKRMGVADDLARNFAPEVVKVADEKTAEKLFFNIAELQKNTKVAPEGVGRVTKSSFDVKDSTEALARLKASLGQRDDMATNISKAKASGQSFDEWLKGQETLFHTTSKESAQAIESGGFKAQIGDRSASAVVKGKGVFLYDDISPTKEFGRNFERVGKEPAVVEAKVSGKIFNSTDEYASINMIANDTKLINKLKSEGYVGIRGEEMGTPVTFIFDEKALKTRSQLKAEWDRVTTPRKTINRAEYDPGYFDKKLPENIEQARTELENIREAVNNHPAKSLFKFANKNGELPEVIGTGGKFGKTGDDVVTELGFPDSETARQSYQDYLKGKKRLAQVEESYRQLRKENLPKVIKASELPTKKVETAPQNSSTSVIPNTSAPTKITAGEAKSIEIQAKQALSMLDGQVEESVSLPKIITNTATPVSEKVHIIDTYLTTPSKVMEKIGFGSEAKELRRAMDSYWKELPQNINQIQAWADSVPKESSQRIFKFLDGQAIDLRPDEQKVAGEIKLWLEEWADRLGLPQEGRVSEYITRLFDEELIQKEFPEELAKIIADRVPGSVYSPFVLRRLGAKGYKEDAWQALDAYVKRSTRKVHMDPVLEQIQAKAGASLDMANIEKTQFQYIKNYIDKINLRPSDTEEAIDNFIKTTRIGYKLGQRPTAAVTRLFRQMTFRGMLGLNPGSALRNLSQGINTYAELGEKYTVLGYAGLFKKGAMEELKREGVLNAGFVQDRVLSSTKKLVQTIDKGLFAFFDAAERINRGAAYFGAKAQYYDKARRIENGMTIFAKGTSEDGAIEYAKNIVRKTQFVFDSVDTPVGMSSDIAKTLMQFQTFTMKQMEFLGGKAKGSVTGDEKLKNVLGLIRYSAAGLAFVYTIGQAFGMEPKELIPFYRIGTPPSLKAPVEVTKAVLDTPDKFGNDRTISQKIKDVGKSAIGLFPGGTQIKKTFEGIKANMEGGSFDKKGREQFKTGQTTTSKLQNIFFGKYAGDEAKDYFAKNEGERTLEIIKESIKADLEAGRIDKAVAIKRIEAETKALKTEQAKVRAELPEQDFKKEIKRALENKELTQEEAVAEVSKYVEKLKKDIERAEQGDKAPERNVIQLVGAYAKALSIDPANAFTAMISREKLGKVEGKLVELQRFYGIDFRAEGGSEDFMRKQLTSMGIPWSQRENYNLEHVVPVSAGGSNHPDNLQIISRALHDSYTELDVAVGKAVKAGTMSRGEAVNLMKAVKVKKSMTVDEAFSSIK